MMTIALTLFAAALGFAQSGSTSASTSTPQKAAIKAALAAQSKRPAPATKPAPGKAEPAVQSIPAGATLIEPNLYRYTDANGKTWNYRQTPFGISKWEETPAPAPQTTPAPTQAQTPQANADPVVVTDLGDSYRFAKKTPFGESTWVRKKSELTDEEKALAAGQQSQADSSRSSANTKPAGNQ